MEYRAEARASWGLPSIHPPRNLPYNRRGTARESSSGSSNMGSVTQGCLPGVDCSRTRISGRWWLCYADSIRFRRRSKIRGRNCIETRPPSLVDYDGHVRLLLRIPQGKGKQGYGRHDHRAWSAEELGPKFAAFICLARLIVVRNDIPRKC